MQEHSNPSHKCFACAAVRVESDMKAFGFDEHLGAVSWVCLECVPPRRKVISGQPEKVIIPGGRPALTFKTIAKAEALVRGGYGWTADQVMWKALLLLEEQARAERIN